MDDSDSNASVKGYKLKDVLIRYDTITYNEFDPKEYEKNSGNLAADTSMAYKEGNQIVYDQPRFVSEEAWAANSVTENILVNKPIQMLYAIVILFKKDDAEPEEFENAKIEEMTVRVGGKSNKIYERGIKKLDMFREANRLSGNETFVDDIDEEEFLTNTYAAVLDFRTDPECDKAASGLTLDGSKNGVKIGIKRASNAPAVKAFVFAVSNSVVTIMNNVLTDVQQ